MSYKLSVKQGNLLSEEEAVFIVNASNTKLILGSGVSMALWKWTTTRDVEEFREY